MADKKKDGKTYSLKPTETQLLTVTQQNFQTVLGNTIAMIAIERLAYQVTEHTRFSFNDDMSQVTISEDQPPKEDESVGVVNA